MTKNELTHDEQRSKMLSENVKYQKVEKEMQKQMNQLERSQPNLSQSEKLRLAAKIIVAMQGNPVENSKLHESGLNRKARRMKKPPVL